MSDINKEKERLMEEIFYKRKPTNTIDAKEYINRKNKLLKEANEIMNKLDDLAKINPEKNTQILDIEKEVEIDFGIKFKDEEDSYQNIINDLKTIVLGQDEAIYKFMLSFKKSKIKKLDDDKAKSKILILGEKGVGKHSLVNNGINILHKYSIISDNKISKLDMSLYTSNTQEHIFLQDLFVALSNDIICIENFETSNVIFLNMLEQLVINGNLILNKRYINNNGQLLEAQTGLVKNTINKLSVKDKHLIFISNNKVSKVIDYFGTNFIDNIDEIIQLNKLDDETLKLIITQKLNYLKEMIKQNLEIIINFNEDLSKHILKFYDKDLGAIGIQYIINDLYTNITNLKLKYNFKFREIIDINTDENNIITNINNEQIKIYTLIDDNELLNEIDDELNQIVGLEKVKNYINSLKSHIIIQQKRKQQGLKTPEISKHMIFMGNPGTGKTTIARLISKYMKAIGILSKGQLVEVNRSNLVGKYVGHTAPLTMQVIKSAKGGVLFIDEAYSLYRGSDDSFGLEAIDTLVKAMEDEREDLIVILAGYFNEMNNFLESNSGLKSRFNNIIEFEDYTAQQLLQISEIIANKNGYTIEEEAKNKLIKFYENKQKNDASKSGNGRLARNKVEEAILNQSSRIINDEQANINVLCLSDFNIKEED